MAANRDPDLRYETLDQAIPRAIELLIRQTVRTAVPGNILQYTPRTKRATVVPSLRTRLLPTEADPEERLLDKPPILNVPVLHPTAGGLIVALPIKRDDPVWLMFSQRGLDAFKQSFRLSDPTKGAFFESRDAVAWPGFGALEFDPVDPDAVVIQTENGDTSHAVKPGEVKTRVGRTTLTLVDAGMTLVTPSGTQTWGT